MNDNDNDIKALEALSDVPQRDDDAARREATRAKREASRQARRWARRNARAKMAAERFEAMRENLFDVAWTVQT